ncbi:hypothetical protein HDK64DRAFT_264846 [Phyllosticta capitalensis]
MPCVYTDRHGRSAAIHGRIKPLPPTLNGLTDAAFGSSRRRAETVDVVLHLRVWSRCIFAFERWTSRGRRAYAVASVDTAGRHVALTRRRWFVAFVALAVEHWRKHLSCHCHCRTPRAHPPTHSPTHPSSSSRERTRQKGSKGGGGEKGQSSAAAQRPRYDTTGPREGVRDTVCWKVYVGRAASGMVPASRKHARPMAACMYHVGWTCKCMDGWDGGPTGVAQDLPRKGGEKRQKCPCDIRYGLLVRHGNGWEMGDGD